jgi:hypothetical protein
VLRHPLRSCRESFSEQFEITGRPFDLDTPRIDRTSSEGIAGISREDVDVRVRDRVAVDLVVDLHRLKHGLHRLGCAQRLLPEGPSFSAH